MYYFNPETSVTRGKNLPFDEKIDILKNELATADAVVIGAGSGLSTAAGYVYSGERFKKYFGDFEAKYGFHDMYSGGFYPYETLEEFWGFWCRYIWINRYAPIPSDLYRRLFEIVKEKDYFVLTTNVDHCFQRAGFDKSRLFYTQGDYGLFQSSAPKGKSAGKTYDNFEIIKRMVLSQGFLIDENNELVAPEDCRVKPDNDTKNGHAEFISASANEIPKQVRDDNDYSQIRDDTKNGHAELVSASANEIPNQVRDDNDYSQIRDDNNCPQVRNDTKNGHFDKLNDHKIKMTVPTDLLPVCPDDGKPMTTNLRSDDLFVEDSGWHKAAQNYEDFLTKHEKSRVLYLELGVGMNTPVIIKYPFWKLTQENKKAFYACVNKGEAYCPENIEKRSVCIDAGIDEVVAKLEEK